MDKVEARATLRVLLSVALADGKLDIDEKRVLDLLAQHEYEEDDPPESRFEAGHDFDRALASIRSDEARQLTWKAALAIATVDRGCSKKEHALLKRIHQALLPDEPTPEIALAEAKYDERFEAIQAEVGEATAAFLRQVGRGASLSQREYETMATELANKKKDLYARAMSLPPPAR
jgi:hypothetical protein